MALVVILEDNADRRAAMRACLAEHLPALDARYFDEADAAIRFLDAHLADTCVVSLDNDLDLKPGPDGRFVDVGEGRHVAAFLAGRPPACPVIIATTSTPAVEAMRESLRAAGWKTRRVVPFDDTRWVETDWLPAVRRAVRPPPAPAPEVRQ